MFRANVLPDRLATGSELRRRALAAPLNPTLRYLAMCAALQRLPPRSCTLGFPRIGAQRQLKGALEAFWDGSSSKEQLMATVHATEAAALAAQRDAGA